MTSHTAATTTTPAATPVLSDHLALLERIARDLARVKHLTPEDTDDFVQTAFLRLAERGDAVMARYAGRCSLRTYLTTVLRHLLVDWQNRNYGRWRPSAAALRLGRDAVLLDRLMSRDGFRPDEAVSLMTAPSRPVEVLEQLLTQLPMRPRRQMVHSDQMADELPVAFDDRIHARETRAAQAKAYAALATAVAALPSPDRTLIALRYSRQRTVQAIAREMSVDAKALYRRFDRIMRTLRQQLQAQGVGELAVARRAS